MLFCLVSIADFGTVSICRVISVRLPNNQIFMDC